jgi:hypothetical protein
LLAASCALGALSLARGIAPLVLKRGPEERAAAATEALRRSNRAAALWVAVTVILTRAALR